jgi:hypothetical protein
MLHRWANRMLRHHITLEILKDVHPCSTRPNNLMDKSDIIITMVDLDKLDLHTHRHLGCLIHLMAVHRIRMTHTILEPGERDLRRAMDNHNISPRPPCSTLGIGIPRTHLPIHRPITLILGLVRDNTAHHPRSGLHLTILPIPSVLWIMGTGMARSTISNLALVDYHLPPTRPIRHHRYLAHHRNCQSTITSSIHPRKLGGTH